MDALYPRTVAEAYAYNAEVEKMIARLPGLDFEKNHEGRRLIQEIQQSVPPGTYMYGDISGLYRVIAVTFDSSTKLFAVIIAAYEPVEWHGICWSVKLSGPDSFLEPIKLPRGEFVRYVRYDIRAVVKVG